MTTLITQKFGVCLLVFIEIGFVLGLVVTFGTAMHFDLLVAIATKLLMSLLVI